MDEDRLEFLLDRYFDQLLTHEERTEMELMLLSSPRARQKFWEAARGNALIRQWGEAEWGREGLSDQQFQPVKPVQPSRRSVVQVAPRRKIRWLLPLAAAAVLVLGCFFGYQMLLAPKVNPSYKGIAVLTRMSESVWESGGHSLQIGEALQPGWVQLSRGAVQIEFSSGARVVLEGPAELQLVSENEVFLRNGKLNARVPRPARGFKVGATEFNIVDRGTEFGCFIGNAGMAEVHVFLGEVSWASLTKSDTRRELKKGQALRISNEQVQAIVADHSTFLSEQELAQLDANRESKRLQDWRNSSQRLRNNPNVLVYLDFENRSDSDRLLQNLARNAPSNSDATIVGCSRVDGRWSGKSAVEFMHAGDRLRVTVPGQYSSLTFLAWVRPDALPPIQESLLMADGFDKGVVHWYIYQNGLMGLGTHISQPGQAHGWRFSQTSPVIRPQNLGLWVFLATVCDGAKREVTHYVNGQRIGSPAPILRVPLRLDTFEIGNWGVAYKDPKWPDIEWGTPEESSRHFRGRMDEFAILTAPLDAGEIQRIYREGRPGEMVFTKVAAQATEQP